MAAGKFAMLCRQEGTGWLGSKDRRETSLEVSQAPPVIMMNWVGEIVVVVLVVVLVVVVIVVLVLVIVVLVVVLVDVVVVVLVVAGQGMYPHLSSYNH